MTLTRIIPWAHQLVRDVLRPTELGVDLTAGTGQDALLLFETVGSLGRVLSFDIQAEAIQRTRDRLEPLGARLKDLAPGVPLPDAPGVYLALESHEALGAVLQKNRPKVVIANLGFLPGSDGHIITRPETTLAALGQAAEALSVGGRLIVVVYTGHPGGPEEGTAVDNFFQQLPQDNWQVIQTRVFNREDAPYLLAAEKRNA